MNEILRGETERGKANPQWEGREGRTRGGLKKKKKKIQKKSPTARQQAGSHGHPQQERTGSKYIYIDLHKQGSSGSTIFTARVQI